MSRQEALNDGCRAVQLFIIAVTLISILVYVLVKEVF